MSSKFSRGPTRRVPRPQRWQLAAECAAELLISAATLRRSIPAPTVTRIALSLLPPRLATAIERRFAARGWMDGGAAVDFRAVDTLGQDCRTPLLELALLGLPGQGQPYREKHRTDVYQRLCAEIMTLGVDSASLERVAGRALNHPDVNADPFLASMLQSFVAERRGALQSARLTAAPDDVERTPTPSAGKPTTGRPRHFGDVPGLGDLPTRDEVLDTFSRLRREFESFVQQFEEARAERVLEKLRLLRQRFPVHVPALELQTCEEHFDEFRKRCGAYRRQIDELAQRGATAALAGDHETGAWVMRRLEAIHRLLPMLLPADVLDRLRGDIMRRASEHEQYQAAQQIRQRKHDVITQIRELAAVVHRYHQVAAHAAPGDAALQRAEQSYLDALATIRTLNTDWLSSLVLELETLLEELDDPSGALHSQLDQFIANVRIALNRLCLEIRTHQRAQGSTPPPDVASIPSPDTRPYVS